MSKNSTKSVNTQNRVGKNTHIFPSVNNSTTKGINNIGICSIDSLRIRIPIDKVNVLDNELIDNHLIISKDSGEIIGELKNKGKKIEYSGVKTRFAIQRITYEKAKSSEFLVILLNSKLLHEDYLEGITSKNIRLIYDRLISFRIAEFTFNDFLLSACTDIDIKKDFKFKNFGNAIKEVAKISKSYIQRDRGINVFNSIRNPSNKGFEFGKRETATKHYPYLKVYHKALELGANSIDFCKSFLRSSKLQNLIRVEVTIKNKEHLEKHNINDNSLSNLISIQSNKWSKVISNIVDVHIPIDSVKTTIDKIKNTGLKPTEMLLIASMRLHVKKNISYMNIEFELLKSFTNRKEKSRQKKKLFKLYVEHVESKETKQHNETSYFYNSLHGGNLFGDTI